MVATAEVADVADFAFTPRDFERVRALIHRHAGIALGPAKRHMAYSRLARRLRALALPDFAAYLDRLESKPANDPEWQEFVNALTTNLTAFFRESHHFPILARHLAERAEGRPPRLWCCAASTGEEPYSIAITALETRGDAAPAILATDIDTRVLAAAREGVYREEAIAGLGTDLQRRWFLRGRRANAGLVRVRAELRARVEFRPLNLADEHWPLEGRFDAIFCRNVMIYFDRPTQARLLRRLAERLEPGGLLFAGHSESLGHARELFEPLGRTVYRRADAALQFAPAVPISPAEARPRRP
ncbi:MAG: CheR family methyltransferase [Betaproteobacteria bacterium]